MTGMSLLCICTGDVVRGKKTGKEPPMVLFIIVIAGKALVHV
jgi:hypothetical protein